MPKSQRDVRKHIEKQIKPRVLKSIIEYTKKKKPRLWGLNKSGDWITKSVLIAIYHDLTGKGYKDNKEMVKKWYSASDKSIANNTKELREIFSQWGETQISLGNLSAWKKISKKANLPKGFEDISLWTDSSDFRLIGKARCSKKSSDCSWKENSPAQRYMILIDANAKIRKIFGGYSPKAHDSEHVKHAAYFYNKRCKGAKIIADSHFTAAKKHVKKVTWVTRFKNSAKGERLATLTKDQGIFNRRHAKVRSRVELPFALMKKKWKLLGAPFRDGKEQQDYLVLFACGVHNANLRQKKAG